MNYEQTISPEMELWKHRMRRAPTFTNRVAHAMQTRINRAIPEKVHAVITTAIKQMTKAVCFGAAFTSPGVLETMILADREAKARARISFYTHTAAAEGAVTGAGGVFLGLADFPVWLAIKMKMLFEIAAIYGFDVTNYKERIYLLHIFELTFSSQQNRNKVFARMENWANYEKQLPENINEFDWRKFQTEYRDYIDIAKLLQLVPGIGAVVGAVVNHKLTGKLGVMAMNAYRMRIFSAAQIKGSPDGRPRFLSS